MNSIIAPVIEGNEHVKLINQDALEAFTVIPDNSIDAIITDPPYFIEGMTDDWNPTTLDKKISEANVVAKLPIGMHFDKNQGRELQRFMEPISQQAFRVLKPGGFFISFSQARNYHRMAVAIEDAGFEIRDMIAWQYNGQPKAFSQDHFVKRMVRNGLVSETEGQDIIQSLTGRKTPQLMPQLEPSVFAQKTKDGTFVENWVKHGTGLIDVTQTLDGRFPGNLMEVKKPTKMEKGKGNTHPTVKPVKLIEHIVKLITTPGQIILDPFIGSGTHGVAAIHCNRKIIGFEINKEYFDIATQRIDAATLFEI